ncbi:solute carrier family 23 protein [Xanthobacter agilis]|uniref:Xanthine/uracil permease n=1 Tax=Xanthobacter agilis TaxID=47492 RepID=A0ABU0L7W8_XANAG|nr:solute carrier family 23 protein [Xanthobacter agilis]MDQ0503234.1 xanthine/uracil permease [Xanthobacter agilis]
MKHPLLVGLLDLLPPPPRFPRARRRPVDLDYGVNDKVPRRAWIALSAQHAFLALTFLVYPLVVAAAAGLSPVETQEMLTTSVLMMGITTMIQCARSRFGSGYLITCVPAPNAIPLASQALVAGGMALLSLSTLVVGLLQVVLARLMRPLRVLLPPEVCGVAMTMLGVSLADTGMKQALGVNAAGILTGGAFTINYGTFCVAMATLTVIVGITVFGSRGARIYAVLAGAVVGWVLARLTGVDAKDLGAILSQVSMVALPPPPDVTFALDWAMAPLVVLVVLTSLLDILSATIALEKLEDRDWLRADLAAAERAVVAIGVGNILGGFSQAVPCGVSRSSIGFAASTRATARVIGFLAGALIASAAFFPKLLVLVTQIPSAVTGGLLLYTAAYMIVNGMGLILSRNMSDRRTFTVGLSIIAGLAVGLLPLHDDVPAWAQPLFSTPLTFGAFMAVVLNALFRLGISKVAEVEIAPGASAYDTVRTFLERQGNIWGAGRDAIEAAIPAVAQAVESAVGPAAGGARGAVLLRARFDEAHLDVTLLYEGEVLQLPHQIPAADAVAESEREAGRLGVLLVSRLADKAVFDTERGHARIKLRFDQ